jgi:Cu-Zn family superoxide dismutase
MNFNYLGRRMAVAVFQTDGVHGEVLFSETRRGIHVRASFTALPPGEHGFHIHSAGDLRGEGCAGACDHWSLTPSDHGGAPHHGGPRHTGDLGNISATSGNYTYTLEGVKLTDLFGRSVIVHAGPDDLGLGNEPDSKITGHSGARIACAIIGRVQCTKASKTRRRRKH